MDLPQLPFVYLYVGRCAASAGDERRGRRPFPFGVPTPLVDKGEASG